MDKLNGIMNNGGTSGSHDKRYRTVPSNYYTFGYDDKAESQTRLIVKEPNSRQVREYELEDGINYYCYGCFAKNKSKNYANFDDDGFLMVPERHDCEFIPIETSNQDQKRKKAMFMEARKLLKAAKAVYPQASPAAASVDSSQIIPVVDLTDVSENPVTDAFGNFNYDDEVGEEMVASESMMRSNASSPEYVPESSPLDSFPSSPSINVPIKTPVASSALSKMPVTEVQASGKRISENEDEQVSSHSLNVTETSSEHTQSITSPSESNGKENQVYRENGKVLQKTIKTDRNEFEESQNVITLDDTVEDDANASLAAEENDDFAPIGSEDYQYGYSQNGAPNCRLIVFDTKDCREFVRQYSKISNRKQWFCLGCYRAKRKHNKAYFVDETFMVPKKHYCQRFKYSEAKDMQREYIQKLKLPGNEETDNKTAEKVHTRSRTVAPNGDKNNTPFNMVILSPRNEKRVGQKVIKTDTSEFDDGYHDYSNHSSSPVEDFVDAGDDEDYHPSHETERTPTRDFKFGFSAKKGNRNGRLIVFEPNDKTKVRQYAWNNCNFYFCIECYRLKKKKYGGKIDGPVFMAPKNHFCKPVSADEAMQQQKEIVEKFGLGRPANGGSSSEVSVRISQRLQNKRDNGADEGGEVSSDGYEDTDEYADPIPYHSTPTDNRRRLVQAGDFKYGVGNANQENFKIIVYEENNRNLVRVYGRKTQRQWYCCGCLRLKHSNYGTVNQQTFNAPIDHTCKPLTHEAVMQIQQRIKDRYRKLSASNALLSTTSPNPGMSLSNVAPVKPGSSVSPPIRKKFASRNEFEKVYEERLRNLVIKNPPTRNMIFERPSENSSISETPKPLFNSSGEYREIDSLHYEYGSNEFGEKQKRLIVYERNRAFVREYSLNEGDKWMCVNCSSGFARKENGKLIVTVRHNCIPILASKSRELQNHYNSLVPSSTPIHRLSVSSVNESSSVDTSQIMSGQEHNKSLLSLPSNYHEVHPSNWLFGFDSYGNPNKRIIVRDAENPDDGHEYRNDRNDTRCLGCAKNGKVAAKLINGTLYVPPTKDHTCEPRNFSEIQRLQKEYRKNMGRKRGRTVFSMEAASNKRARTVVEKDNESNPEDYDFEDSYMDNSAIAESQIIVEKSKVNKVATKLSSSNSSTTVSFYCPSAFFLTKCCKELNIKYSNEAYKFWSHILIENVKASSRPLTTYKTKEAMYHGFSCFSLYFTGNETNTAIIREMFNRYVYNNFKSLGTCMGHDFSQYNHETPIIRDTLWSFALTEIHLECLARWFECRIGIFEERKWKRYGNWDVEESATPTFLMEIKDEKYNPILTLA